MDAQVLSGGSFWGRLLAGLQSHRHRLDRQNGAYLGCVARAQTLVRPALGAREWSFAAYSPDGTRIVTTSSDNTARIWDARSGALVTVLAGHGDSVRSAAYSPDGTRIVTASYDKTARIWDARTGKQIAVLIGHSGMCISRHFPRTAPASSPPHMTRPPAFGMRARVRSWPHSPDMKAGFTPRFIPRMARAS